MKDVITWFLDRNELETEATIEDEASQKWLGEFRKERALMVRLERKQMEGALIARKDIEEKWAQRTAGLCSGLELLSHRLPPVLQGKSQQQMSEIIEAEVQTMRGIYHAAGSRGAGALVQTLMDKKNRKDGKP